MKQNESCPCPNTHCKNHGHCEQCAAAHESKDLPSFCKRTPPEE